MAWQKLGCRIWPISFGISIGCSNLARKEIRRSGQAEQLEFYCPIFAKPLPLWATAEAFAGNKILFLNYESLGSIYRNNCEVKAGT